MAEDTENRQGRREYRMEELARLAGISVRTLRFYRERKLIPPPRREGRIAWYDDHHLARLRTITALLERGCTAVICASDMMALGAIRAARQRGLAVPGEVSVIGYDDSPLIAFTDPPLTTIRQPVPAMGQAAVRALLEEIGGTPTPHSEFVFLPELVVRGSTATAPSVVRGTPRGQNPTGG